MDAFLASQFLGCLMYLCCTQFQIDGCCLFLGKSCKAYLLPLCIKPYLYAVFGNTGLWKCEESDKDQNRLTADKNRLIAWVVTGLMVAPLFSLASHVGYIVIAWITEPEKSSLILILGALLSFFYLFLVFKQCYVIYEEEI